MRFASLSPSAVHSSIFSTCETSVIAHWFFDAHTYNSRQEHSWQITLNTSNQAASMVKKDLSKFKVTSRI